LHLPTLWWGVSAREAEGARPNGRMRLAPRVSIVASSSAPRRDCASVDFRPGAEVLPAGSARDFPPYSSAARPAAAPGANDAIVGAHAPDGRGLLPKSARPTELVGGVRAGSPATRCWHQRSPAGPDHAGLGGRVDPAQRRRRRRAGVRPGRSHAAGHPPTRSCALPFFILRSSVDYAKAGFNERQASRIGVGMGRTRATTSSSATHWHGWA
jgi:hypothetical protein